MKKRARPSMAPALALLLGSLVLAGCAAGSGPGWTYVPPAPTPVASAGAGASGGAPAASGGATAPGGASSAAPAASGAPASGGPAASAGGGAGGQMIDLNETASLQITDPSGKPVTNIVVHKGETVQFMITNTAGFVHNLYVGKVSDLEAGNLSALTGTGDFTSGMKEFTYTFSDTSAPLGFGCMVPGHYQAGMKGTFTIQ